MISIFHLLKEIQSPKIFSDLRVRLNTYENLTGNFEKVNNVYK